MFLNYSADYAKKVAAKKAAAAEAKAARVRARRAKMDAAAAHEFIRTFQHS
jgi:hypothetical protein